MPESPYAVQLHETIGKLGGRMDSMEKALTNLQTAGENRHAALLEKMETTTSKLYEKIAEQHGAPCAQLQTLTVCVAKVKQREATAWRAIVVTASIIGGLVGLTVAFLRLLWR